MNTPEQTVQEIDERAERQQAVPSRPPQAYAADERWVGKTYIPEDPRKKSPALATILSLMPGLGQVYVGYYQQGFTNIIVAAGVITLLSEDTHIGIRGLEPLLGVFLAFFWLYNIVDAGRRAAFYNQALTGLGKTELPDLKMPSGGGSLAGGTALVIVGLIFFSYTMFGWSLEWLERWWPIAIVAGGCYLIYRSIEDRRRAARANGPGSE